MTTKIKIDNDQKIVKRAVSGVLHTDRAVNLLREISMKSELQQGYDILIDLRKSKTAPEMTDLMAIMSAWSRFADGFDNKIAVIFPKHEEHTRFAQLFKACMEAQGLKFRQLYDFDSAIEWLKG
ncbi:MAG: hypothetical protein PVJ53_13350 [Desulfobacterales bacterium]